MKTKAIFNTVSFVCIFFLKQSNLHKNMAVELTYFNLNYMRRIFFLALAGLGALTATAQNNTDSLLKEKDLSEVIVTDTIPIKTELSSKIKVLSCAELFADVMKMVHEHKSISDTFII